MPSGGLLVVGRTVSGWTSGWAEGASSSAEVVSGVLDRERKETDTPDGEHCPMSWVVSRSKPSAPSPLVGDRPTNTKRSTFWKVAHGFATKAGFVSDQDPGWSCNLAWTNLYKVAPVWGGNPSVRTRRRQFDLCANLFELELEALAPRCVLLLTGEDWASGFLPSVHLEPKYGSFILGVGRRDHTTFLLADHPQTRPEMMCVVDLLGAWNEANGTTPSDPDAAASPA